MRPDCAVLLQRHTELATNPLYIFGESYAGHYVPHIATYCCMVKWPSWRRHGSS